MLYQYRLDPIASGEYEDAYNWYEQQNGKAADHFKLTIDEVLIVICSDPHRYKNTYKNLREVSLKNIHTI